MLILSEAMTRELVDLDLIWSTINQEAVAQAADRVRYSTPAIQVLQLDQPKARYRIKTCALLDIPVVGIRIIGYPQGAAAPNSTRFVLLSDPATGDPLAFIDDHWIYTLRTAASAALGLSYLTPDRPLSVGMIGAGNLAGATLQLLKHLKRLKDVRVTSRRAESREAFAKKWSAELGVEVRAVATTEEAAKDCDLLVTSTDAAKKLVDPQHVRRGMTICTLGTFELAPEIYRSADKLVVDRWNIALESPDMKELVASGAVAQERVHAELHELVSKRKPGRQSSAEIIVFRTDGLVTQDTAIAYAVYQTALKQGIGIQL
jgi:alanine dehydrogenase